MAGAVGAAFVVGGTTGIASCGWSPGDVRQASAARAVNNDESGISGWAKKSATRRLSCSPPSPFSRSFSTSFDHSPRKQSGSGAVRREKNVAVCATLATPDGSPPASAAAAGGGPSETEPPPQARVRLGSSLVEVPKLGVGAWAWGDRFFWNEGQWDDKKVKRVKQAFEAAMDAGLPFFDTAEVYGAFGGQESERLLGRFVRERRERKRFEATPSLPTVNKKKKKKEEEEEEKEEEVIIATKFAALPWRIGRGSVMDAVKASLRRLGVERVDLYQLHWPGVWQNEAYWDGLADVVEAGLVRAVGVSNYSATRVRAAHAALGERGVPLACNQIHYNLLYRAPETNGTKAACDELGVSVIAYSPLAQGVLSGKYTPQKGPSGPRGSIFSPEFIRKATPLLDRLRELGEVYGKTPTQLALNWLLVQGNVVPIPGAKTADQAKEFGGALGWQITHQHQEELRQLAKGVPPYAGFPLERL